jgi:hypothetical protein
MRADRHGIVRVWWARQLLLLGRIAHARQLTQANLSDSAKQRRFDNVARCHWILGCADTAEGLFDAAIEHLAEAEAAMRHGHMLQELPALLLAVADLHRRRGAWADGLRYIDEALRIAAPRDMRLGHADALVLRGCTVLDRELAAVSPSHLVLERARDDGDAALQIARDTGYAWAERDALFLIADASTALGDASRAKAAGNEARQLARRLQLPPDA